MPQSAQLAQVQVAVKPQSPPPMLGPALGLYAKDPEKKYLLLADFRGCGNLIRPRPLCLRVEDQNFRARARKADV